jgi:parallel beta-helix repeat protein/predicted outer membrane repeat protein
MHTANLKNLMAACILFSFIASTASGDIIYVNPGESIQAAIDDANDGDQIEVRPGAYNEAINFNGKAIRLYSIGGPEVTIIDANGVAGAYHVVQCVSGEGPDTVLEGFTITGGNALTSGGGMRNDYSNTTVTNCIFTGNSAGYGGGMCNLGNSSPTVTNCTFSSNKAGSGGGGMYCEHSSPTLTNCTFINNTAGIGGGIYSEFCSPTLTLTNCTFSNNMAVHAGGGIHNSSSSPTVSNCTFSNNTADIEGGGMKNSSISSPTVINCTFTGNKADFGGGMNNDVSSPIITNCTFNNNMAVLAGGGIFNSTSIPTVTNCILWGNTPDEIYNAGSSPSVTYSDVQGGFLGTGNIDADPFFADVQNEDLRLPDYSPCVDLGNNNAVPGGVTTDLDGNTRIVDGDGDGTDTVDMGAYEFQRLIHNITQERWYERIQAAIDDANTGDEIEV